MRPAQGNIIKNGLESQGNRSSAAGVCQKVTDKSGIAYVMRIEREFDALLSLQSSRTPHHRRPFLISEACFHCHAPPCTPPCLRVSGKNEMKKKLGGPGGFFNCEFLWP
jgi:hypothetical protein